MRASKLFSVVAVLGALALMQVSVDAAWAAKKSHHEKQVKKEKKEDKGKKKDKKEDKKEDKDKKDKRETNNCPGWLSKGCSPGACRCPLGPEKEKKSEKDKKAEKEKKAEKAKKVKKAKKEKEKKPEKDKNPQKAESDRRTQIRKGAEPAQRMRSGSRFVIRYDKGADALDRPPQIEPRFAVI